MKNAKDETDAKKTLAIFERHQKTEQNSAISRARTGKQWKKFDEPDRKRLYPNLKWLPSRSANPRESHQLFYNRIWAKDDPFWDTNTPGTVWGCKCDWTDTDAPATNSGSYNQVAARGLKGNPGKEKGNIFSDDASYYTPNSIKAIGDVEYKDHLSNLRINVNAHMEEIGDNVRTGRIMLKNFPEMDLGILDHLLGRKNPEYRIDGLIGDAKRIEQWKANSGFRDALDQGASAVVIDLFKLEGERFKQNDLARSIADRHRDFLSGKVSECYVVWKDKAIRIDDSYFKGYNSPEITRAIKSKITQEIKKALNDLL